MSIVRWSEIAESLRSSITEGVLKPGDRLPSEKVVAAQWGVCRMTAHRALSELEREGLVLRKRRLGTIVIAPQDQKHTNKEEEILAEQTIDLYTGFPRLPKTVRRVALLCFHPNDYPQVDYIHGFRMGLPEGHHLLFCDTLNRGDIEGEYLRRLSGEVDAVCLFPSGAPANTPLLARLVEEGVPIVCLDRVPDGLEERVDGIVTDNYGATQDGLQMLAERGHRHIALLTTEAKGLSSIRERRDAWRDSLLQFGVAEPEVDSLLRRFPPGLGYDFDMLVQVVHDALYTLRHTCPVPPTAVLCLDDFFLSAAMEACDRMRLRVPEEFELLSFSDYPPLAARLAQNSHRITQRTREMGRMAAERLSQRLSGTINEPVRTIRVSAMLRTAGTSSQENSHAPTL